MTPRLAFKPDSSFFRKIATGAIGARYVSADLGTRGHTLVELERGSTDTKLWKDVKRKRVRIPDLVCCRCGLRVESRAKTGPSLSMSHSDSDAERAWDYGMVDEDCIAFPVCAAAQERDWSAGRLELEWSHWREQNWIRWQSVGHVNYFRVLAFRSTRPTSASTKGVTEGSETALLWEARFSSRAGTVGTIHEGRVTIRRDTDGHAYTWRVPSGLQIRVVPGQHVGENQVIASDVAPMTAAELACPGRIPEEHIPRLLASRERTQRFTGVKLARILGQDTYLDRVAGLVRDAEEDTYVRLEGASYLTSVGRGSAPDLLGPFLGSPDQQTRLEAVIATGEAGTPTAVKLLCAILDNEQQPFFLRSAAAWSLGKVKTDEAARRLVRAFSDVDLDIRDAALEAVVSIGGPAAPILLDGLRQVDANVAAGCAEALRQQRGTLNQDAMQPFVEQLRDRPTQWAVWLAGHLPRERVAATVADLQRSAPQLHYAITLLWAFVESWVARHWEPTAGAPPPAPESPREA